MDKRLEEVSTAAHEAYPDQVDRLAQLDSHLATCDMVLTHLADAAAVAVEEAGNG